MTPDKTLVLILCLFSVVVNVRVFCVVVRAPRRNIRTLRILVLHLSTVAILYALVGAVHLLEEWGVVDLNPPGFCKLLHFVETTLYFAFPLNWLRIVYELTRSTRFTSDIIINLLQMGSFIWIPAGISSIPVIFMTEHEPGLEGDPGTCKSTLLMGDSDLTLAYELFAFTTFHLLVVGYMIYAVFKIRCYLHYLLPPHRPPLQRRMWRRVQKVWFICVNSVVFSTLWTAAGIFWLVYNRLLQGNGGESLFIKISPELMIPSNLAFFLLSSFIYLGFLEKISAAEFCMGRFFSNVCCLWWMIRRDGNGRGEEAPMSNVELRGILRNRQTGSSTAVGLGEMTPAPPAIVEIPPSPSPSRSQVYAGPADPTIKFEMRTIVFRETSV